LLIFTSICISRVFICLIIAILTYIFGRISITSIIIFRSILIFVFSSFICNLICFSIFSIIFWSTINTSTIVCSFILCRIIWIRAIIYWLIFLIRWIIDYFRIWKVCINSRPFMTLSTPKKRIVILLLLTRNLCYKIRFFSFSIFISKTIIINKPYIFNIFWISIFPDL